MKAACARHDGRWEKLTGEDKTCATKRAFKRQLGALPVETHVPPPMHDGEVFFKPITVQKFLPSWLELRPRPVETETIESEEAA
jgi:hypothetical protein